MHSLADPRSRSDPELVAAARARGPAGRAAFAELVERHRHVALRACRRAAAGQDALAADAVQEATLHALLALDRLRDPGRFGAWLTGIALNVCRRQLALAARAAAPVDAEATPHAGPGPAEQAERAEAAARVRAAIAALPVGQREAVTLFYLAGLTQAEVAEHLGTAEGAVKARLHKARAALRRHLDPLREDPMPDHPAVPASGSVPVRVADVVAGRGEGPSATHVAILREEAGPRTLAIWIGAADAAALAGALEAVELPRPGTHALTLSLLRAAGRQVTQVRVRALTGDVFLAEVVLDDGAVVDARPSDALTLALTAGAPILAEPALLELDAGMAAGLREDLAGAASIRGQAREAAAATRRLAAGAG